MSVGKISPVSSRREPFPCVEPKIVGFMREAQLDASDFLGRVFSKDVFVAAAIRNECSPELIGNFLDAPESEFILPSIAGSEQSIDTMDSRLENCINSFRSSLDGFENDAGGIFDCSDRVKKLEVARKELAAHCEKMVQPMASRPARALVQNLLKDLEVDCRFRDWRACSDTISFLEQFFRNGLFRRTSEGMYTWSTKPEEALLAFRVLAVNAVEIFEKNGGYPARDSGIGKELSAEVSYMQLYISGGGPFGNAMEALLGETVRQIKQIHEGDRCEFSFRIAISEMHQMISGKIAEMRAARRKESIAM